jgi:hypothetical protein
VNVVLASDYEESLNRVVRGEAVAAALNYHVGPVLAARLFPGEFTVPPRMFREVPRV